MSFIRRSLRLALAGALVFTSFGAHADINLNLFGESNKKFNGVKSSLKLQQPGGNKLWLKPGIFKSGMNAKGWTKSSMMRTGLYGAGLTLAALALPACGGGGTGGSFSCDNELDIRNTTRLETFDVYVDGWYVTSIAPGATKALCMSAGFHTVDIYESFSGDQILDDSIHFSGTGWVVGWNVNDPYEAEMDIDNQTGGYVSLYVDGQWWDDAPDGYWAYPIRQGSHSIYIEDYDDGGELYYSFDPFTAGNIYIYTITDPLCVEFIVFNNTGESVDVYIDGFWVDTQPDFTVWSYWTDTGFHTVRVESAWDGFDYWNESGIYSCGFYPIDVW